MGEGQCDLDPSHGRDSPFKTDPTTLGGMLVRLPRGRLLAKLLVAMLVPATFALALFGAAAHEVARRVLEQELGRRLATAATSVAMLVLPEQLSAIAAGDEQSNTYANLRHRVEQARERLSVRRVCGELLSSYGAGTAAELTSKPARPMMGERSTASNWLLPTDCTCEKVLSCQSALGLPWMYMFEPPSAMYMP